jgi:uncharacterized protein YjdB
VNGQAAGTPTITATKGGVQGTTTVTVSNATLASITITPSNPTIAQGTALQLTATGNFSDNTTQDLTSSVSWTSSDLALATVSNGLVSGQAAGTPTITATQGGVHGTTTVTVSAATVTLSSITISPSNPTIAKGTTVQLTATGNFSDGTTQDLTNSVSWTSSDLALATVNNGLVNGQAAGTPTITATQGGVQGTTTVKVTAATLTLITITPANQTIGKGDTLQLTATATFSDGTTQDVTNQVSWTSSDDTIAHVISSGSQVTNGRVKGNKPGTATITATLNGFVGSTMITVTP